MVAGFQVSTSGRILVSTEACSRTVTVVPARCAGTLHREPSILTNASCATTRSRTCATGIRWAPVERGERFAREAVCGPLMRRAVHALIGDRGRPLDQPRIQMRPRVKALAGEGIARDKLDARLYLAFRLSAVRRARPQPNAIVAVEIGVRGMPRDRAACVRHDHRLRIVDDHAIGDAAEVLKRELMPAEPVAHALARKCHRKKPSVMTKICAATLHRQLAVARNAARADVFNAADAAHPEHFVLRPPTPGALPTAAWVNPPNPRPSADVAQ